MEVLSIVASSWPLAIMFIALCIACVVLYLINWFKRSDAEDKALRASQATAVAPVRRDY